MYRNVQTGQLDFVYGLSPLVAARAYLGGQDIRLITRDVRTFQKLIGPKDVTDPQDLEGKRVGGYASSSSTNFAYHVAFDKLYGVDYDAFYDARALAPPIGVSQLKKGEIDAFWTHPPWTSKLLASGEYGVVARAGDLYEEATGHTLHTADGATQTSLLKDKREALTSYYNAIADASKLIESSPETSLTESGYTELFEFTSDAELRQFVDEVSGLYVKEYDTDAYVDDVSYMFEEASSRGYIESVPDDEIFNLI
jgi:ABC-type nitrate/sulfonate/bicarbonate transport system substrate-binding protein